MNIPENDMRPVLLIEAPRQLFPFARRILADATRDGGYPPIMLDPIDFMALYRQGQQEAGDQEPETIN
jgi:preprotein translocase subunit SecB